MREQVERLEQPINGGLHPRTRIPATGILVGLPTDEPRPHAALLPQQSAIADKHRTAQRAAQQLRAGLGQIVVLRQDGAGTISIQYCRVRSGVLHMAQATEAARQKRIGGIPGSLEITG